MAFSNFHDQELDEISFKTVKRMIGESIESRNKGLQILKNKLMNIDDLHACLDEGFLLSYLRVSKFDANKAFERLRNHYQIKKKYPHIFNKFYPSAAPTALDAHYLFASPKRAQDHSAVIIYKRGLFNPSTMVHEEVFLLDNLILNHILINPVTQMCGATVIFDFAGYGFQHLLQDKPWRVLMAIDTFQNCFPLRYRAIHILNAPYIFSTLYNLCSPFLTKKIKSRLHFHERDNDWKSLHASIFPEILPKEYGGTIPDSDIIDLAKEVIKYEEYFKEHLQYGYIKKKTGYFK